jgi:ring-1,2-phenylacetyl-CoA epoxidase subunit PaaC
MLQAEALQRSSDKGLAGVAAKAVKEFRYHVRHSTDWVLKLGGGTIESHARGQRAVDELWPYTGELFLADDVDRAAAASGFGVDPSQLESTWESTVRDVLGRAGLTVPHTAYMQRGGRQGRHTEHLGHMLAEMQIVARSHPGASW